MESLPRASPASCSGPGHIYSAFSAETGPPPSLLPAEHDWRYSLKNLNFLRGYANWWRGALATKEALYIDRIDLPLPEANIASILAAYTGAEALLEPLPSVSKADRKRYAKLGLKNEALALQIIEVGRANPNLIPRGIDFEMIDRDITAREQLMLLKIQLQRMLDRVDDAMLLLGVDVYAAALSIYHCLRRNADTTNLKETVDELRKGFARPSRKKKTEAEPASMPAVETQSAPMVSFFFPSPELFLFRSMSIPGTGDSVRYELVPRPQGAVPLV